jgi:hypothetical protein
VRKQYEARSVEVAGLKRDLKESKFQHDVDLKKNAEVGRLILESGHN